MRKYKETLFDILSHKSGKTIAEDWDEFQYTADEIIAAMFDERELPFGLDQ